MANKGKLKIEHLKNETVTMDDGVMVNQTSILDGGAKDSPVFDATNTTEQYKTSALPKNDLGGKNDPNG